MAGDPRGARQAGAAALREADEELEGDAGGPTGREGGGEEAARRGFHGF